MMNIRENPPKMIRLKSHKDLYQDLYDELTANNVQLQTQDRYPLAIMAINLYLVDEATKDIRKNGMMITVQGDRNKVTKPNPALNALKDAQAILRGLFKEFRMTPSSRPKTVAGTGGDGKSQDGWEKQFGKSATSPAKNESAHNPFGKKH